MADAHVTVSIGTEPYAVLAQARHHAVLSDEPGELGGKDTGPSPYELLLMGLGSCKIITAKMYADRKGWPLTAARIELTHDRPNGRTGPERITARFVFEGDLTDEQRARLQEIAEKCPVQKTITGGLVVESSQG
jgi:putative redox protein